MKRVVVVIVVVSLLVNCTYSTKSPSQYRVQGPIVVSERVGEVIDAEEREFFDLFLPEIYLRPVTYRYESAAFRAVDGGGYELRISVAAGTLVVVNKDPKGIDLLADYIDNYEEIKESKEMFVGKWGVVDYDFLGLPITKNEIQMTREYMIATEKSQLGRLNPIWIGASIGSCVGGIVAYLATVGWETQYDLNDPGIEGTWACVERTSIAVVYLGGMADGAAAGGLAGCLVGKPVQESYEPGFEDSIVLEAIKEAREPRVVE